MANLFQKPVLGIECTSFSNPTLLRNRVGKPSNHIIERRIVPSLLQLENIFF